MNRIFKFGLLYLLTHIVYFSLIMYSFSTGIEKFAFRSRRRKASLAGIFLPLLYQYNLLPSLHRRGTLPYNEMKIAVDFATIYSLTALFLLDNSNPENGALTTLFAGIVIHFALSNFLIDMFVAISDHAAEEGIISRFSLRSSDMKGKGLFPAG